MDRQNLPEYRLRVCAAMLCRRFLHADGESERLRKEIRKAVSLVFVPALRDTSTEEVRETVGRYFEQGDKAVVVPVLDMEKSVDSAELTVLVVSESGESERVIALESIPESGDMLQLVENLTPAQIWAVETISLQDEEVAKALG
ncbi:MAG: hypothetical protein SPJ78_03870 [Corynebacterium camporealensis]|uniref:hypothetical protein n=1 Tax=Corynebacterium camporealensis TaxID=161896 RepID=UPI002A91C090|nr:hypothetical protein [Corynebacterium camporealensis]MDY5839846.1 hypothetical protein [Corynebacterium camporealensis]